MMDHNRDSDHPSKKKCNQHDCLISKCWYVHKTLMPTSNDVKKYTKIYMQNMSEQFYRQK